MNYLKNLIKSSLRDSGEITEETKKGFPGKIPRSMPGCIPNGCPEGIPVEAPRRTPPESHNVADFYVDSVKFGNSLILVLHPRIVSETSLKKQTFLEFFQGFLKKIFHNASKVPY